ncbi:Hypothetical protein, putative [Bodo saltans]|uniref:Uncharacterized protein n=1 Tax=Bodo saltans TaxID=75058 RepID=A0A0S4JD75_BODSA|nr:Hypothetical protein, putative [Bodo saltans]|eukprot:CUG88093.1 Hypothetical protein, putative [Bodo saltans]
MSIASKNPQEISLQKTATRTNGTHDVFRTDLNTAPTAAILLQWQSKCDHLASKLDSEKIRSDELMEQCQRLREETKQHSNETREWESRVRKLTEHLETTTQAQQRDVNHLQLQLRNLQTRRSLDEEQMKAQATKIEKLESALNHFLGVGKVEACTQTLSPTQRHLGSVYEAFDGHHHSHLAAPSSHRHALIVHPSVDDLYGDVVISTVASPPSTRSRHSSHAPVYDDAPPPRDQNEKQFIGHNLRPPHDQQQQQNFMKSIQQTFMSDPELSEALGELFVTNKRQRMRNKLKLVSSSLARSDLEEPSLVHAVSHGPSRALNSKVAHPKSIASAVVKYAAHEGLNSNPFDSFDDEELAPRKHPENAGASAAASGSRSAANVTPPRHPVSETKQKSTSTTEPPQAVAMEKQPSDSRHFAPSLDNGTSASTTASLIGSLFTKPREKRAVEIEHAQRLPQPPSPRSSPESPNLVSTVVSSASSSSETPGSAKRSQSDRKAASSQAVAGWFDLEPLRLETTFYEGNRSSTTPIGLDATANAAIITTTTNVVAASRSSSMGNVLVKSPSPKQPSTPLPPTPSSQSPLRSRESIDRIEKLRHELQFLIDMRTQLHSTLSLEVGPPTEPIIPMF